MPSSTASCTQRTASPSTARPCANHQKNPPSVASLTPTTPSEPLKPSMGAAVRDHRNAVRDRSESLSAINRNTCPQSPESAPIAGFWRRPRATEEAAASLATATKRRSASALAAINRRTVRYGRKQGRDWCGGWRKRVLSAYGEPRDTERDRLQSR